jgi:ankyrin repeat protein
MLIANGANIEDRNNDGRTALILAAEKGYSDTVAMLIANGANINARDKLGRTALIWATVGGRSFDIVAMLILSGTDVNAQDKDGDTPLANASYTDNTEIIKIPLEKGANVNHINCNG